MADLTEKHRVKVFLSHSSADADLARRLARDLRDANIDVWLDQWELGVGEAIKQRIEHGIDEAEFVIVLLTSASVASDWVDREWRQKVHDEAQTERIAVVPVRGEICEIPDFLAQRSHTDISGGSYLPGFIHLLKILRHYSDGAVINVPESTIMWEAFSPTMLSIVLPIALEVGRDLIPCFEPDSEGGSRFLDELAPRILDTLQAEFGFPFPGIHVRGNESYMPPRSALIMIEEVPEFMLEVSRDDVLVDEMVEGLAKLGIQGEKRENPATGRAYARIAADDRAAAESAGLTTWDAAEYLSSALYAVMRRMAALFLDIDVTRRLVDTVERTAPNLVAETVPMAVSWFELADVLQRLVEEEIGIGDMRRILQALSRYAPDLRDTVLLAEHVRHALRGQITAKFTRGRDSLSVLQLDPEIESLISSAIQRTAAGSFLALDPQPTQDILAAVRGQLNSMGPGPVDVLILTIYEIRRYIRKLVELEFPWLHVVSRQDLEPETEIQTVARIRLGRSSQSVTPTSGGSSV